MPRARNSCSTAPTSPTPSPSRRTPSRRSLARTASSSSSRRSARTRRWRCSRAPRKASRRTTLSSRNSPRCKAAALRYEKRNPRSDDLGFRFSSLRFARLTSLRASFVGRSSPFSTAALRPACPSSPSRPRKPAPRPPPTDVHPPVSRQPQRQFNRYTSAFQLRYGRNQPPLNHFPNHPTTAFQPRPNHRKPQPLHNRPSAARRTIPRLAKTHDSTILRVE